MKVSELVTMLSELDQDKEIEIIDQEFGDGCLINGYVESDGTYIIL